jgi:hypothetical protein
VARFRTLRKDSLARELRESRPGLSGDFVDTLSEHVDSSSGGGRRYAWRRVSFAVVLTLLVLGALASVGGLGYAASSTKTAVTAVKQVIAPSRPQVVKNSAAQSQYARERVTICHHNGSDKPVTITISRAALPAHLRHGDTIGPCS